MCKTILVQTDYLLILVKCPREISDLLLINANKLSLPQIGFSSSIDAHFHYIFLFICIECIANEMIASHANQTISEFLQYDRIYLANETVWYLLGIIQKMYLVRNILGKMILSFKRI